MNLKTKIILSLFVALALSVLQKEIVLAGFGISPPSVSNNNLVPGSFYAQDVYLVQSDPEVDLNVVAVIDAGKINGWFKIENGNSFIIPKGKQQFPMRVSVKVPSNADLGQYKGTITLKTSPVGSPADGVSIVLGALVTIDLNVTSIKISDFSIQNFTIPDVVKGSPIKFLIKVKNDGNVENGPTKVGLTFFDEYNSTQLGQQEVIVTEKAKSFETKDISVNFKNDLDIGSYWAGIKIYSGDKVVVDNKIVFAVVPSQSIVGLLSAVSIWTYFLIGAVILVLVIGIVLIFIKRKKNIYLNEDQKDINQ